MEMDLDWLAFADAGRPSIFLMEPQDSAFTGERCEAGSLAPERLHGSHLYYGLKVAIAQAAICIICMNDTKSMVVLHIPLIPLAAKPSSSELHERY